MDRKKNFTAGFLRENPVFSLYLGLCSTLAITTTLNNAIGMGVAVIAVLIMSNVIISLIRNITPNEIRIPVYIVVIAALVKVIQMLIQAYAPALDESLGTFIPLHHPGPCRGVCFQERRPGFGARWSGHGTWLHLFHRDHVADP